MENTSTTNGKYSQNGIVSTNYNLFVFKSILFRDQILRIVNNVDKKPYFLSSDVSKILLYKNLDSMAKMLVKDNDKFQYKETAFYSSATGLGIQPNTVFINLQGFNDVLLRTKSKNAKSLKKWLLSEILPCFDEFYTEESESEESEVEVEEEKECGEEETKEELKNDEGVDETKESKKIFKLKLSNNEVSDIDVREDGYINATQLCKAGNKILRHYISSEQTHNYLENLSSNIKIPILKLFDYKIGKSYVHRKVAYHLSHWISPQFETQFDNCLKEYDNENNTERIQLVSNYNQPLVLNNIEVTTRQEDGYINLTALCKAGNKEFNAWFKNKKTEAFLQVLSSTLRIPVDELVKYETGSNENRAIWGHPQIAINIAQWISQEFDVQVSKWIFELKEQNEQLIGELSNRQIRPRLIKDTTFKLKLLNNEILDISIRKDGYINATQLCKAGNKLFGHYQKSKQTQDYLQALSSIIGIPILDLLDSKVGGSHSGTYVHRKVAYHLAQWISPQFAVQVSNVLDELMLTGKVELGKEKSDEELENAYKEKLSEMENQLENTKNELKVLSKTHNSMLRRQKRTPYEIGNVVYIVSHEAFTGFYKTDYFKVGEATQTSGEQYGVFVNRLSGYNTSAPINFKVNFLIYIEENKLVENSTLVRFRKNLNPSNKEWIKSVDFKTITEYIVSLCELMNIEYKIVVNDPIVQNMEKFSESCGEVEEIKEEEEEEEEERKKLNGKYECMNCHECNISDKRAMNCVSCARQLSRKVKQRPTFEQLQEDTRTMSMVDIGKKYGVSDNCIRKWIKNS